MRLAVFWVAATGRPPAEATPDVVLLTSATAPVRLLFLKVPAGKRPCITESLCSASTVTSPFPVDY